MTSPHPMIKKVNRLSIQAALVWNSDQIADLDHLLPVGWTHLNQPVTAETKLRLYELQDALSACDLMPEFWFVTNHRLNQVEPSWLIQNPFLDVEFEVVFKHGKILTYQFFVDKLLQESSNLANVIVTLYNQKERRRWGENAATTVDWIPSTTGENPIFWWIYWWFNGRS